MPDKMVEAEEVTEGDTVKVDYTGRLENGEVFDSSIEEEARKGGVYDDGRNYQPLEFKVGAGKVIKGFEEGVKGMKMNEKKEVEIPPEDAYGESGDHPLAGKTLIFEIEVKGIE